MGLSAVILIVGSIIVINMRLPDFGHPDYLFGSITVGAAPETVEMNPLTSQSLVVNRVAKSITMTAMPIIS